MNIKFNEAVKLSRMGRIWKFCLWVLSILVTLVYLFWLIMSDETGFLNSLAMYNVIGTAYSQWETEHCIDNHSKCDPNLRSFIYENVSENTRRVFEDPKSPNTPQIRKMLVGPSGYTGCFWRFWPFHSCLSIRMEKPIFENKEIRKIVENAIANPCQFTQPPVSNVFIPNHPYKKFRCHISGVGNPYKVVIIETTGYANNSKSHQIIKKYEATR